MTTVTMILRMSITKFLAVGGYFKCNLTLYVDLFNPLRFAVLEGPTLARKHKLAFVAVGLFSCHGCYLSIAGASVSANKPTFFVA